MEDQYRAVASRKSGDMRVVVFYPALIFPRGSEYLSYSPQHRNFEVWKRHVEAMTVVAMVGDAPQPGFYAADLSGVSVLPLPPAETGFDFYVRKMPAILWRILKYFIQFRKKWDVVVLFQPVLHNQWAFLLAKLFRKPVIVRMTGRHDLTILETHAHIPTGLRRLVGRLHAQWTSFAQRVMAASSLMVTDGEVSFAPWLTIDDESPRPGKSAGFLVESFLESDEIVPSSTSPRDCGDARARIRVLSLSRIHPQKGIETLLRAAALLRDEGVECRVDVVGPAYLGAYGAYGEMLNREVLRLQLEDVVHLHGWVDEECLNELWQSCHCIAVPCRSNADGVPKVVLEAMFRGVPVVATHVGGIPRVIADGTTGFLVPPDAPDAFAAALRRVIQYPMEARRVAALARRQAQVEYSASAVARRFATLVEAAQLGA